MGKNTGIEWCDLANRLFAVNVFVAFYAQCYTVILCQSQFRELCIRLNVMGMQVTSLAITAMLAGVAISFKYLLTPGGVFGGSPIVFVALIIAVNVIRVLLPPRSSFLHYLANKQFGFCRMAFANPPARLTFFSLAHGKPSMLGVFLPLNVDIRSLVDFFPFTATHSRHFAERPSPLALSILKQVLAFHSLQLVHLFSPALIR